MILTSNSARSSSSIIRREITKASSTSSQPWCVEAGPCPSPTGPPPPHTNNRSVIPSGAGNLLFLLRCRGTIYRALFAGHLGLLNRGFRLIKRVIRRPHQRPGFHMLESHTLAGHFVFGKFVRMHIPHDRQMLARRLQVLP